MKLIVEFPENVEAALRNHTFVRIDAGCVVSAFVVLGVEPDPLFRRFFETFTGGYHSDVVGRLLRDVCEGSPTIVAQTTIAREAFALPSRYLVLTELGAGSVLVYDIETDRIFDVDFEGGDEELLATSLHPTWPSFRSFLEEFF